MIHYDREQELLQQIARATAEKENLDVQNKDYQQILIELSSHIKRLESDLRDCREINAQLTRKLERLTEI